MRQRGRSEKLLRRYFGPYRVLQRLNDVNYQVVAETGARSSRRAAQPDIVHVARMKPHAEDLLLPRHIRKHRVDAFRGGE